MIPHKLVLHPVQSLVRIPPVIAGKRLMCAEERWIFWMEWFRFRHGVDYGLFQLKTLSGLCCHYNIQEHTVFYFFVKFADCLLLTKTGSSNSSEQWCGVMFFSAKRVGRAQLCKTFFSTRLGAIQTVREQGRFWIFELAAFTGGHGNTIHSC